MSKPKQFALVTPFNLFPNGTADTLVVGVGTPEYADSKSMALFLIFASEGGRQMSVELTQQAGQLDEANDEFFLRDWADNARAAEVCIKEGLIVDAVKQPVQAGEQQVSIYKLKRGKIRDMTPEELEKYTA